MSNNNATLPERNEGAKKELKDGRTIIYWQRATISALLIIFLGLSWYLIFKDTFIASILLSTGSAIFVTAFIQKIQNKTIEKTLSEDVSTMVTKNVSDEFNKFRSARNLLSPAYIYWGAEKQFEDHYVSYMKISSTLKFMSISANYLLNKRLIREDIANDRTPFSILLLLLNPTDQINLDHRSTQMKNYHENKTSDDLRIEIIENIYKAYRLCKIHDRYSFAFRFHNEILLFRMELPNDSNLFLSYYESQRGNDLGPVARYERGIDVYTSYSKYFETVWSKYITTEISIDRNTGLDALIDTVKIKFPTCCQSMIDSIFR